MRQNKLNAFKHQEMCCKFCTFGSSSLGAIYREWDKDKVLGLDKPYLMTLCDKKIVEKLFKFNI